MSKENLLGIYSWLKTATVPKMVDEALRFYGVKNNYHDPNNPVVKLWGNILGVDVRNFYDCNADHHYHNTELDEFVSNHSTTDSQHIFGQNLKFISDGHLVPWCGLFMGIVAKNSGKESVKEPLYPLNWGNFGTEASIPMLGDVLIFIRLAETGKKAGHLGYILARIRIVIMF